MIIDNLACVVSYFDDEREIPVDYVLKWTDGYEAFVCRIQGNCLDSISLGRYPTEALACRAIYDWNRLDDFGKTPTVN